MKEPRESDLFGKLEREIVHDLSGWRDEVIELYDWSYDEALEAERAQYDERFNLVNPAVTQAMKRRLEDALEAEWRHIDSGPKPGEYMQVTGPAMWYDYDEELLQLQSHPLRPGLSVYGAYSDWRIMPYYDEVAVAMEQPSQELLDAHVRQFGIHICLREPIFTDVTGNLIPIYMDEIYVPIHYRHAKLTLYADM